MTSGTMFLVVISSFCAASGDKVDQYSYLTPDHEVACALRAKSSTYLKIYTRRLERVGEGWRITSEEWCPLPKPKEVEPFDFEKLLDEVEGVAKRKPPVNRFQTDSNIAQLQVLIADPDTDEKARDEASMRVLELRIQKQEEALSRFMGIK